MAEGGTIIDDLGKYTAVKVKANQYIIYSIFALIIAFIAYYIIVYKSPKPFEKGKTIRWVVTGDVGTSESGAKYSYDGIDYLDTKGQYLRSSLASAYGKSYDNDNFFWIVGGVSGTDGEVGPTFASMVNSYNGYLWIVNKNPLKTVTGLEYGLSGGDEPLWLATGFKESESKNNIIYSKDGLNWEHSKGLCFSIFGTTIAYGKKLDTNEHMYVAGGYDDNGGNYNLLYSYEGLCWQVSSGYSFGECNCVAYGVSSDKETKLWVATGGNEGINRRILYSLDGINWNPSTGEDFSGGFGSAVAFGLDNIGDPIWVAVGTKILYSKNGHSWFEESSSPLLTIGYGVAYGQDEKGDSLWIATGEDTGGTNKNEILYSFNGISWKTTEDAAFSLSMGDSVASNILKYGVKPFI